MAGFEVITEGMPSVSSSRTALVFMLFSVAHQVRLAVSSRLADETAREIPGPWRVCRYLSGGMSLHLPSGLSKSLYCVRSATQEIEGVFLPCPRYGLKG
jgi:hypothetical protein